MRSENAWQTQAKHNYCINYYIFITLCYYTLVIDTRLLYTNLDIYSKTEFAEASSDLIFVYIITSMIIKLL